MTSLTLRPPVIALLSGSSRQGSFNAKLLKAASLLLDGHGAETKLFDLKEYKLPLYDMDLEKASFPDGATRLKADLKAADAIVIASPEFNGFPTPELVNAITWATRGEGGMYDAFKGKFGLVIAASPGALGGMRGLGPTRELLSNCGVTCLSNAVAIGGAMKAFSEDGSLKDPKQAARLAAAVGQLERFARVEANRTAACQILSEAMRLGTLGEYGSISIPEVKAEAKAEA